MDAIKLVNRLPSSLIENLKEAEQDVIYHPEGSVYIHTLEVLEKAIQTNNPSIIVAAIFHDLGKLDTEGREMKNGIERIHHYGHEFVAIKYLDKYFSLYEDLSPSYNIVKEIIYNHMKAHLYLSGKMSNPNKREKFEHLPYFKEIIIFAGCDK